VLPTVPLPAKLPPQMNGCQLAPRSVTLQAACGPRVTVPELIDLRQQVPYVAARLGVRELQHMPNGPVMAGQRPYDGCRPGLCLGLFSDLKRVIDFDAEVPHSWRPCPEGSQEHEPPPPNPAWK
jgi:hypothetical protein